MQGRNKKVWNRLFGVLISLAVLFFLFTKISLKDVLENLGTVSLSFILIAFLFNFLDLAAPSLRLMLLAKSDQTRLSFAAAYRITLISAFGNYVLPLRLGEVIKIFAISGKNTNSYITKTEATGFVFIERALDLVVVILFFFLALFLNGVGGIGQGYVLGFGLFLILMVVMLFVIFRRSDSLSRIVEKYTDRPFLVKVGDILTRLLESFGRIKSERKFTGLILYTILYWLVVWFTYWFAFICVGNPIGFKESFLIMTVGTLGLTIPSGPGGVGVLQGAFVVGGALLGIHSDISLAAGLFYQAVQAVFVLVFGGVSYLSYQKNIIHPGA